MTGYGRINLDSVTAMLSRQGAGIAVACLLLGACAETSTQSGGAPSASAMGSKETQPARMLASADGVRTVQDGIFTKEQSQRGELLYMNTCRRCHQRDLRGDFVEDAPPLVGDEFLSNWSQWTVGDLFEFLTTEMPPKRKDRLELTAENHADMLAFILDRNGFPPGQIELPPRFDPLGEIEMNTAR